MMSHWRIGAALVLISAAIGPTTGIAQKPHEVRTKVIAQVYEGPSLQMAEQQRTLEELQASVKELLAEREGLLKDRETFQKLADEIKVDHLRLKARMEELEAEVKRLQEDSESKPPMPPRPAGEKDTQPPTPQEAPPVVLAPDAAKDDDKPEISESQADPGAAKTDSRPLEREFVVEGATFRAPWFENRMALRREIRQYVGHLSFIRDLAVSPNGEWGASIDGHSLRLWSIQAGSNHSVVRLNDRGELTAVEFTPQGDRLAVVGSGELFLMEVEPLRVIWSASAKGFAQGESLDFSEDGSHLAVRSQEHVSLWETETGKQLHSSKLPWKGNFLDGFDLLDKKALFIAGDSYESGNRIPDKRAKLVNLESGEVVWELIFSRDPYGPQDAVLMPDRKRIITAEYASGQIKVWDVETGSSTTWKETQEANLMKLSESGDILITAGPGNVTAWHVPTGKIIEEYRLSDYEDKNANSPTLLATDGEGTFAIFMAPLKKRTITYCRFRTKIALHQYEERSKEK